VSPRFADCYVPADRRQRMGGGLASPEIAEGRGPEPAPLVVTAASLSLFEPVHLHQCLADGPHEANHDAVASRPAVRPSSGQAGTDHVNNDMLQQ
jgi:hypothetical protein